MALDVYLENRKQAGKPFAPVLESGILPRAPGGRTGAARRCKSLASELARLWVRWGGKELAEDPAPLVQQFQGEDI
jgi:hypothetical protein